MPPLTAAVVLLRGKEAAEVFPTANDAEGEAADGAALL